MENKINILIVEDHILVAKLLMMQLSRETDIKVVGTIGCAEDMITILQEDPVDLILLDLILPMEDGLGILRLVKEKYPLIKIIIITMIEDSFIIHKAIKLGANGYLTKNVEMEEIIEAIKKVMNNESYLCKRSLNNLISAMNPNQASDDTNKKQKVNKTQTNNIYNSEIIKSSVEFNITSVLERYKGFKLSERENQILKLIIQGFTSKEISGQLDISCRTAETHRKHILRKFGAKNSGELFKKIYNN